ncbi:MAG: response regulator [Alphaproteobacteria bacterium]|nr:response regulator [Alphaproteobacteria bacterium]
MNIQTPFSTNELLPPTSEPVAARVETVVTAKTTVCVVDDDPAVRHAICSMLERGGYATAQASDGKCGLSEIERSAAAVAVLDIIMPDHEGIETIALVKERFPNVKILAISGGGAIGAETYLTMARGMGADATLAKPFRADVLLPLIAELLQRAREPHQVAAPARP